MKKMITCFFMLILLDLCILASITRAEQTRYTYPIVDTGVTSFYSDKRAISSPKQGEAFYGQDAHYDTNAPHYIDNGDGTVVDTVTGLVWQQVSDKKMTHDEALLYAQNSDLAGYSDWRIPNIKELYSLIQFTGSAHGEQAGKLFIDTEYFVQPIGNVSLGEREIDAQTWSSTYYVGTTMNKDITIFGVNFIDGRIKGYPKFKAQAQSRSPNKARNSSVRSKQVEENKMYVRLVRGNANYGENQFVDNNDGTITDYATGLMWQKNDSKQGLNWEDAISYCENLELAGYTDWKLPDAKELHSIVDYSRSLQTSNSPAINPHFVVTEIKDSEGKKQYPYFWSSTTHLNGKNPSAYAVYFAFGEAQGVMHNKLLDVHGAGAQRSDPKSGLSSEYPKQLGPQGDVQRVFNFARAVRILNVDDFKSN